VGRGESSAVVDVGTDVDAGALEKGGERGGGVNCMRRAVPPLFPYQGKQVH